MILYFLAHGGMANEVIASVTTDKPMMLTSCEMGEDPKVVFKLFQYY